MKPLNEGMKLLALLAFASGPAFAQTTTEKARTTGNDVKRDVKKTADHVDEDLCTGTAAQCAGKKVQHRATEAKDTAVDKTNEAVDRANGK